MKNIGKEVLTESLKISIQQEKEIKNILHGAVYGIALQKISDCVCSESENEQQIGFDLIDNMIPRERTVLYRHMQENTTPDQFTKACVAIRKHIKSKKE